ncbi:MAG: DUF1963 domain-containing protein [Treponema sp.]|nr:DUF1963 domain-containing protein [Treponema sp.]
MYIIKNNLKQRVTIFENTVFAIFILVFLTAMVFSLFARAWLPAVEFAAFTLLGAVLLYLNNAPLVYVYDKEISIRKIFKKYSYQKKEVKSISFDSLKTKYEFLLPDRKFSIPVYYINAKKLIAELKTGDIYFTTQEGIAELKNYILKNASTESFLLLPNKNREADIFSSKIGGLPYWDLSMEYPLDADGKKMHLLCQLNFGDCKFENKILPKEGILQFFISSHDDIYGMSFDEPTLQKNWRIVFHKNVGESIRMEDIQKIVPAPDEITRTPILKSMALEFKKTLSYMHSDDYRMPTLVKSAVKEILNEDTEKSLYGLLGNEKENPFAKEIYDMVFEQNNYILGYPSFVQSDVREGMDTKDADYYDTSLLHLDSLCKEEAMCWGDMGCANFLINSEALKKLDFSKVYYTWDCT